MADEMVLGGQRVLPEVLLAGGFEFANPDIDSCFESLFGGTSGGPKSD
jgi:NAD dependent epimerase/dehydratase family enzyme